MLNFSLARFTLFRRLTPCLPGHHNLSITLVQRASDSIDSSQESKLISSSAKINPSTEPLTSIKKDNGDCWKTNLPCLNEFFDKEENWGENVVRVGRSWRQEELRIKSNSDLHKLWFVLYKEKNRLLTMQEACKAEGHVFPSEERIEKVEESMENLEKIVRERNKAYFQLEVGENATSERSMAFRLDQFGRWRWQPIYEHYKPFRASPNWRKVFGPWSSADTLNFARAYRERRRNALIAHLKIKHSLVQQYLRRFPNLDINYLQKKFPEVPVQYIKDNLNFDPEYCRLVSKGAYEELH
ncbi:39S ribosomal protein L47, mitochondrial-like [Panonychus citri]|uniref:39S ribosomal protein L47, mitochondrial-like n=1 Tax=Panonychus citri TaxID=50023 RepID=UPI002307FDF9|nr:39S ribosomal protein L47, mitochondrial-like [Panonychus citri]XP_053208302.1 39S ribosomal protein L47, mitochondrial-like [Panonychus citri]